MIAGQKVALGRHHRHPTVTVTISETTLANELPDGDVHIGHRTTERPIRSIKADRPRTVI
jgi:hypothetical protein